MTTYITIFTEISEIKKFLDYSHEFYIDYRGLTRGVIALYNNMQLIQHVTYILYKSLNT